MTHEQFIVHRDAANEAFAKSLRAAARVEVCLQIWEALGRDVTEQRADLARELEVGNKGMAMVAIAERDWSGASLQ